MKLSLNIISLICLLNSFVFGQNDLNFYIDQAKANSPLIKDTKNQNEASKIELQRINALYTKPQITFNAALAVAPIINFDNGKALFQVSPSDATNYQGYDIAASNGGVYQGMFNINQPLFNSGKLKMASEQLAVAYQINQNTVKLSEHDLEKIVGDQYVLCLQDLKQRNYIDQLIQIISEQKLVVNKLVEGGLLKQSDLLLVNIEQQTQLNNLEMYKATYRRDLMDLNILCGINDTGIVILKDLDLSLNLNSMKSNFTEKFRIDSLNLLASQKLFDLKYKPQLNAFANAGLNGVYVPTLPNRFGASAGLNFSVFIFDGKQKSLNKKKTDVLIRSTQSYRSNFITINAIRKNKLLGEITSLNERITISNNQLKDYKQLLEYYKKEVITGQQSVTTYITTIKSLATLQRDFVLMQTNKQLLINTYNYWNW
ncbi:MAG: TolC family protein [Bacteroidetes bacterium]|nr:TolC family protein [Bacteroidota bacterium]